MKLKTTIFIIAVMVALSNYTFAQTYSLLVHDDVIEDFFRDLSKDLPHEIIKFNEEILYWNEKDLYGEADTLWQMGELTMGIMQIDSVKLFYTEKDLKYVVKQYENLEGEKWYHEDFKKFDVIDTTGTARILSHSYSDKKMGKNYSYTFSVPLFSLNQEYAIVQQEFYCGLECSTYCIYMYKKGSDKKSWYKVASWKCLSAGDKFRQ